MFFELEDIKRRHSAYWDIYNVGSWVRAPDSTASWNYQRGALSGIAAHLLSESWLNFHDNYKLLLTKYEPPSSLRQAYTYFNEICKLDNFKKSVKNRIQYSITLGATDIAARISLFRWLNNGWQLHWGSFDYGFPRKIPGCMLVALLTAPIGVPFEMARMAYYGDKTFPKEVQKGYKSYWNALRRIPFEEGPYYLFKNSFPLIGRNFMSTFTLFFCYDFLKDKLSFMWRSSEIPYEPCLVAANLISVYLACLFSYPIGNTIKEMVDFWPKEKGGICTFDNNYRKAFMWLWYHDWANTAYPGFIKNYLLRQGPLLYFTLYFAEKFGIFSYWRVDYLSGPGTNSWEDSLG